MPYQTFAVVENVLQATAGFLYLCGSKPRVPEKKEKPQKDKKKDDEQGQSEQTESVGGESGATSSKDHPIPADDTPEKRERYRRIKSGIQTSVFDWHVEGVDRKRPDILRAAKCIFGKACLDTLRKIASVEDTHLKKNNPGSTHVAHWAERASEYCIKISPKIVSAMNDDKIRILMCGWGTTDRPPVSEGGIDFKDCHLVTSESKPKEGMKEGDLVPKHASYNCYVYIPTALSDPVQQLNEDILMRFLRTHHWGNPAGFHIIMGTGIDTLWSQCWKDGVPTRQGWWWEEQAFRPQGSKHGRANAQDGRPKCLLHRRRASQVWRQALDSTGVDIPRDGPNEIDVLSALFPQMDHSRVFRY